MDPAIKIVRLHIDGHWSAREFGELLLYEKDLLPLVQRYVKRHRFLPPPFLPWLPTIPTNSDDLIRLSRFLYPAEVLTVRRIRYGSEGTKDLAGLGAIVGHIKDLIIHLVDLHVNRDRRRLENEKLEVDIEFQKIETARNYVSLAKECGYDQTECRKLVSFVSEKQEPIVKLIEQSKLLDATVLDKDEPPNEASIKDSNDG
jgi:hypothetical protein